MNQPLTAIFLTLFLTLSTIPICFATDTEVKPNTLNGYRIYNKESGKTTTVSQVYWVDLGLMGSHK